MELNQVTNPSSSSLAMQGWSSPTSFACKGRMKNGKKLEYSWNKRRINFKGLSWTCYKWWNFNTWEFRKWEKEKIFDPFELWTLKWWLLGVLCTIFCPNFDRVFPCSVTNLLKTNKQNSGKNAQNHFGALWMLVKKYVQNLYKTYQVTSFKEFEIANS